ncbi:MAG TPA: outer membrane beta-barrel protein [Opitutus sp.]|nr:outer membrane beta-barrel protein [Opitutus sp.]
MAPQTRALFTLNEGKELIFVSATYSIGLDTNVFTRSADQESFTQNFSFSADYSRQAGLISVTANIGTSTGRFESIRNQDFADPSLSVAFRKRYGRTTGSLRLQTRRESQPDPDAGQRTEAWNHNMALDVRYPVNDRYFFTNGFSALTKLYTNKSSFSDLTSFSDSIAINYAYTSKLDLNAAYKFGYSQTSHNTNAFDQSLTVGASGGILPKLSGSLNMGVTRRANETSIGIDEVFTGFSSGTSLKWLYSRRLTFTADLNSDFSTTSTDITVLRTSGGLHATASLSSKYIVGSGITYTISNFLGIAGAGRRDEMLQFDASLGLALTTHIRTSVAYSYMLNRSNFPGSDFERHTAAFTITATY